MLFKVTKASDLNMEIRDVEINTMEDLKDLSARFGSELIVYFKGVANEVDENEIIIYDDYME